MHIDCAFDDLAGSPNAILRGTARAGASSGPNAGKSVIDALALKVGSGILIFFATRFWYKK